MLTSSLLSPHLPPLTFCTLLSSFLSPLSSLFSHSSSLLPLSSFPLPPSLFPSFFPCSSSTFPPFLSFSTPTSSLLFHLLLPPSSPLLSSVQPSSKTHPGLVQCLELCPTDMNKLLIGYEKGVVVLWDLNLGLPSKNFPATIQDCQQVDVSNE